MLTSYIVTVRNPATGEERTVTETASTRLNAGDYAKWRVAEKEGWDALELLAVDVRPRALDNQS